MLNGTEEYYPISWCTQSEDTWIHKPHPALRTPMGSGPPACGWYGHVLEHLTLAQMKGRHKICEVCFGRPSYANTSGEMFLSIVSYGNVHQLLYNAVMEYVAEILDLTGMFTPCTIEIYPEWRFDVNWEDGPLERMLWDPKSDRWIDVDVMPVC